MALANGCTTAERPRAWQLTLVALLIPAVAVAAPSEPWLPMQAETAAAARSAAVAVQPLEASATHGWPAPAVPTLGDSFPAHSPWPNRMWHWQLLPQGLIYRSYLAGQKESRFRACWVHEEDEDWLWDVTVGGRVGLLRYGNSGQCRPEGFQVDVEGAAFPRLDLHQDNDLVSADFRGGIPVTYGTARYQVKLAYYHLSSHLGDEFLLRNPGFPRLNYSRDVLVNGHSFYLTDALRLYAEAGWAFASDVAEPWEFQFGVGYSPARSTGLRGAPFAAVGGHLRQEVDYGGNLVLQVGWAWRGSPASGLLRMGFEYFSGKSEQFSFFDESEDKVGLGIWYDF